MNNKEELRIPIGESELIFETGEIARQANGAVLVRQGDTVVFATACAAAEPSEGIDFLPLRVDYQEKFSAAGKTLGGFMKREGRPSQQEILTCRLIDRPIRPLFPEGYYQETQLLSYVWSYDEVHRPDILAICASSAALVLSDIPFAKAIGAVRIGCLDGNYVVNPTTEEIERSSLDLVLAGTEDAILMIEGHADFLTEEQVLEAIEEGHVAIREICHGLQKWREKIGKPKEASRLRPLPPATLSLVEEKTREELLTALQIVEKQPRDAAIEAIGAQLFETYGSEEGEHTLFDLKAAFKQVKSQLMRQMVCETKRRADGRALDEIRPISIRLGFLPRTHGSALFTRGETQAVAVCTLGGEQMAQRYEDLHGGKAHRFYLHYTFPPFSVGEVGRVGAPGRREIGHGKLAERALQAILPPKESFPYVIRLESNITESNGSSSMASVCGGCLAFMDAGVPITRPVSGIAMGLILEQEQHTILSDILGLEDALGDMDFKVTGDAEGITALQMDIKVEGINLEIMRTALAQAKKGRIHILEEMLRACPEPRKELAPHAPRIETVQINPSKIGEVIGPGGKQIRAIVEETGVEIDIDDSGLISLAATNLESIQRAMEIIEGLVAEVVIGKIYRGTVKSVVPFGAFVEILPGKEGQGLCHISELAEERVEQTTDICDVGDVIPVKVVKINERGQLTLSRKEALREEGGFSEGPSSEEKPPSHERRERSREGSLPSNEEGEESGRSSQRRSFSRPHREAEGEEGGRRRPPARRPGGRERSESGEGRRRPPHRDKRPPSPHQEKRFERPKIEVPPLIGQLPQEEE